MLIRKVRFIGSSLLALWFFFGGSGVNSKQDWHQYVDVEQAGWSKDQLETAREFASSIGSSAVLIVDQGNVVAAWGEIEHPYKAASIRKSLYDAAIGASNLKKPVDINTAIQKLGLDDIEPLSAGEKKATLNQLMMARSGVYHPAAYETKSNADRRPPRNSAQPGSKWYYNNWDFNLVPIGFQKLTGKPFDRLFEETIVRPLGFEDYDRSHMFEWLEPRKSRHAAMTYRISARDLARVGKLYLDDGRWNGKELVSPKWIEESIKAHTVFGKGHYAGEGNGYGRMWWVFSAKPDLDSPYQKHHRIAARGAGGHIMVLFPELDLVIVHRTDTDTGRGVSGRDGAKLMDLILKARKRQPTAFAKLGPVRKEKLSNKKPVPLRRDYKKLSKKYRDGLTGRFMFSEKMGLNIYQYKGGLFVQPLGLPLADAEAFEVSDKTLRSPLANFIIKPIKRDDGKINSIEMTFGGRTQIGKRTER